jgi:mRNA interferase RelE/StbE
MDYKVYITPVTFQEIKNLPGKIKQRIKQVIRNLATDPYPAESKLLNLPNVESKIYRIRLDKWRILYSVTEEDKIIDVLGIRLRPPYDYGDLEMILQDLE